MSNLMLKEFRCVEETDEVGSDSPYFVVFSGRPGNPAVSNVSVARKSFWDNDTDSGELKGANVTVATAVDANTLVLAALVEEDNAPDIAGKALTSVRNWMHEVFQAYGVNGSSPAQLEANVSSEFRKALNANLANDDLVAIKRVKIASSTGPLPLIHFFGDGGHYKVRFNLA